MDLRDQLQHLFPDHKPEDDSKDDKVESDIWLQEEPILCKYEKRKGKPNLLVETNL